MGFVGPQPKQRPSGEYRSCRLASLRAGSARSAVMIEQVAGLLYVALVISRVVGVTVARQRADPGPE